MLMELNMKEMYINYFPIYQWKSDKQHGFGIEIWPDNAKYEGDYIEGRKHGKGILNFSDGSKYEGSTSLNYKILNRIV